MSKIILLNGPGSAGKTSIAKSIQYLSEDLWLSLGVDSFFDMLPHTKINQYLNFISGENNQGPTMSVKTELMGTKVFGAMPNFACLLADEGHNVIIDEVLFNDASLKDYVKTLKNHTVYYIGVFCDLKMMQEREILRQDRYVGLSNDQNNLVHQNLRANYDFKVDTTETSSFNTAKQILDYIKDTPNPKAFSNIYKMQK